MSRFKTTKNYPSQRQLRVGELVRHAIAEMISVNDFHDEDLKGLNLTISEVVLSPDLKQAKVYYTNFTNEKTDLTDAFKRVKPFIRREVGKKLKLKYTPDLHFYLDTSFDYAQKINQLLDNPIVKKDLDDSCES